MKLVLKLAMQNDRDIVDNPAINMYGDAEETIERDPQFITNHKT
jgi:hypothetical protein